MKKTPTSILPISSIYKKYTTQLVLLAVLSCATVSSFAQEANSVMSNPMTDVIQLSTSASVSASQDFLKMSLSTTKEGLEASQVQEQLKKAVDEALKQLKANAGSNTYSVQTGSFSLNPRYSNQGKINGWQGSAELSIEGKDFGAIAQAAGAVKSMVINSTIFSLSEEKRLEANAKAQSIAIDRFKAKSQNIAKSFGYIGYNLKNVMISEGGADNEPIYSARSKNIAFAMADSAPVPVQAGSADVVVRVNGSIILKK